MVQNSEDRTSSVKRMVQFGFTDEDICLVLNITTDTLTQWRLTQPSLQAALMRTEAQLTMITETEFFDRALGFDREVNRVLIPRGSPKPVSVTTIEEIGPNFQALVLLLNNLEPRWQKDRGIPAPEEIPQDILFARLFIADKMRAWLKERAARGAPRLSEEFK